ncbi:MAG: sigma-70 family RNA polymerase sigma factor [Panacagrimonas sp.]
MPATPPVLLPATDQAPVAAHEPFAAPGAYTLIPTPKPADLTQHTTALPGPPERSGDSAAAHPWTQDDSWDLVDRIGRGDQAALATLYRRVHGRLSRFIMQMTHDPDGIDDIVNETMLVVWQKAAVTMPRARVTTWITGIAYLKALKALERRRRTADEVPMTADAEELIGEDDTSLQRMESAQLAGAAMRALSPEQRAVMELVYHDGMNYSEIALVLACPENTVKTRMFHARKKLRALWPTLTGIPNAESEKTPV